MVHARTLLHDSRLRRLAGALFAATLTAALLVPQVSTAQEYTAARKVGRGLAGMALGFLDIPGNMVRESRENGALSGMTVGLARGLGDFVTRELVGVFEFVTAPFPLPAGFVPILEPEYPWQYFDETAASGGLDSELRGMPGVTVESRAGALIATLGEDLLFRTGSASLSTGARERLAAVAASLNRRPSLSVTVRGHTDNTGSATTNQALSSARAEAVTREFIRGGVDPLRISALGMSASDPIASNATAQGRRLNRRVEIELR